MEDANINITDQRVDRFDSRFHQLHCLENRLGDTDRNLAQALRRAYSRQCHVSGPTLPNPRQAQAEFDKQARLVPLWAWRDTR